MFSSGFFEPWRVISVSRNASLVLHSKFIFVLVSVEKVAGHGGRATPRRWPWPEGGQPKARPARLIAPVMTWRMFCFASLSGGIFFTQASAEAFADFPERSALPAGRPGLRRMAGAARLTAGPPAATIYTHSPTARGVRIADGQINKVAQLAETLITIGSDRITQHASPTCAWQCRSSTYERTTPS